MNDLKRTMKEYKRKHLYISNGLEISLGIFE